jgi:hypothetical protein
MDEIVKLTQQAFQMVTNIASNSRTNVELDFKLNEVLKVLSEAYIIAKKEKQDQVISDKHLLLEVVTQGEMTAIRTTIVNMSHIEIIGICESTRVNCLTRLQDAKNEYERRQNEQR